MLGASRVIPGLLPLLTLLLGLSGCATPPTPEPVRPTPPPGPISLNLPKPEAPPEPVATVPVMLGIDVLEAQGFAALKGKRVGLLTHPAGVNRHGMSTIEILRRAPSVKLVALFAPEHGLYGTEKASVNIKDAIDARTGLPVYSLHGQNRKPTKAQLRGLDALVIDLQDIGVRSYTFNVVMRYAMDACFTYGVEVVLLDRPNPLGGLKVDGPLLGPEPELKSGVGAFRVPYVHGLTMGELARMAAQAPGVLDVPESVRAKGKLTVIPMRGWRRSMRWPETGLAYVPTSQLVQDFAGVVGYAMVGLGCEYSGFKHGLGTSYPFRGISFKGRTADQLEKDLNAMRLPGLSFRKVSVNDARGQPTLGVFVEVTDWDDWNPTQLSFHLMRLACRYDPPNPFVKLPPKEARSFNIHVGDLAWWSALKRDGAKVDVEGFLRDWRARNQIYQQQTKKYWLYN